MKEIINFSITLSLFALAIQFYVVESRVHLRKTKVPARDRWSKSVVAQTDNNASEEFFNRGDEQMEKEYEYIENDEKANGDNQGEQTNRDRVLQTSGEAGGLEEKKTEGVRIEDVQAPDIGEDNLPAEPPVDEAEVTIPF